MKLAVVGGGIAGLAAAWEARDRAEVTVWEPEHLGGKLRTAAFAGHPVDTGPDAFIARVPDATALCEELGLADDLVAPSAGRALVWWRGRLRPLPDGLVLGVPGRLGPLLTAGILSPGGIARAGLDLVLPASPWPADLSVGEVVGRRFGRQVVERLVDPLLGGIHAGRVDDLSVEAVAPQLAKVARASRSLLLGLRGGSGPAGGPVFLAPRGGMEVLVDRLVGRLADHGVTFRTEAVDSVGPEPGGGQSGARVRLEPGGAFDRAVVAVPAGAAAGLLKSASPDAAEGLAAISTASVVLVTFAYRAADVDLPDGVSGFLVPQGEGRLMTACSFGSRKWPHWSDPDTVVLRVSAGRAGDDGALRLADGPLSERLQAELAEALGVRGSPTAQRISRWPGSFPQYQVGHGRRVEAIEAALAASLPQVALAGASYRGSGIPACIASGRRAAARVLA